jgi:hypothetical protein
MHRSSPWHTHPSLKKSSSCIQALASSIDSLVTSDGRQLCSALAFEEITMNGIDIFYQGEGISGIEHIEFPADETIAALKIQLAKKHGFGDGIIIFLEDEDEPVDEKRRVHDCAGAAGVKVHVHRCRHIAVSVTFNGEIVTHKFSPSATVARIKKWAAEHKFGMTSDEAGEHVLQLKGTKERPSASTHIGSLVVHHKCELAFDLVPDERVQGANEVSR